MVLFESLRHWMQRTWYRISGVALSHPPEPADSVSIPRRPVATGPLTTASSIAPDALVTNGKIRSIPDPAGPPPTIQSQPHPEDLPCIATIRPNLGTLNIRSGPGLTFPRLERAAGGMKLGMAGLSGPDEDGHPWVWLTWAGGSGWVRRDLVNLNGDCSAWVDTAPTQPEPPFNTGPDEPGDRWPLPVDGRLIQGYHNTHTAYDLAATPGETFYAGGPGVVIKHSLCANCQDEQATLPPATLTAAQQNAIFTDPAWGFGNGNTLVVRHDYDDLPEPLQTAMAAQDMTGGFAYVSYGHLARLDVAEGEVITAETALGTTGATGICAGPTLHLSVKIGREETIDDEGWQKLPDVHPGLLFFVKATE